MSDPNRREMVGRSSDPQALYFYNDNCKEAQKDAKELSETEENGEEQQLFVKDSADDVDDHIPDIENPHIPLLTSVRKKLDRWPPLSSAHSIYKVPKQLLVKNPSAYTPRVISIGPIHHGREGLEAMEEYKQRFFADFLQRTQLSLEDYVVFIKEREGKLRSCYADTIHLESDELVEIVMVDAAFIVLLLVKHAENEEQECCRIFKRPCHLMNITEDMLLLENQPPLFILDDLFNFAKIEINCSSEDEGNEGEKGEEEEEAKGGGEEGSEEEEEEEDDEDDDEYSFIELACEFINFRQDLGVKEYDLKKVQNCKMEHFLDCLRVCHLSSKEDLPVKKEQENLCTPTITELHRARVRFVKSSSTHLLDIEFKNGVLSIPHMFMGDSAETIYRNLLAFEQCHYSDDSRFTDYVCLMDELINSPKDIDLLVEYGIIENTLGDSVQAASVFNSLGQGLSISDEFCFPHLCEQLQTYYKEPWHKWKATLRQDYFNNPWAGISVIAAVTLLVLTVIQTVFSIIS
ncbi:hypothetical protein CDL15_Pgr015734 [Punica granatum]|uniref:Uncharacterized protein n=1 Tax=Punica granatum TaxID=22663 RepID=A0A218XPI8_PUNGR|nr:hypothetical protein CDL15_Pgr015734 [Punica granatum]PKI75679.1 hypothetical protein CRG98_003939 [Punica granatum]